MQKRHTLCHIRYAKYLGIEVFSDHEAIHVGTFSDTSSVVSESQSKPGGLPHNFQANYISGQTTIWLPYHLLQLVDFLSGS